MPSIQGDDIFPDAIRETMIRTRARGGDWTFETRDGEVVSGCTARKIDS